MKDREFKFGTPNFKIARYSLKWWSLSFLLKVEKLNENKIVVYLHFQLKTKVRKVFVIPAIVVNGLLK